MSEHFYITTPIYYVNARPHLGHAYTTIVADVSCRFHAMRQADTFFLTGTDEHGDKIVISAKEENLSPRVYVDKISQLFKDLWSELNIKYNQFIRTTDMSHIAVVEQVLQNIYDSGDIYFSEYEGLYCFGCERFYTERELVDGKCPDHQKKPEIIKESNYFFRMSRYQQWLIDHIHQNPDFIRPERYKNEVLAFLREPLEDLCISRPKTRLQWGITLPFDENYVTYVWFDALLNYVSALGYPDGDLYKKYWGSVQHIVAKDILKPHGIYWSIMLKAAGMPIYNHLNVHGYWNIDHAKMSKSLGNVADPLQLKNIYGLDAFRYFLMREMVFGLDADFSEDALIQRINSDLANDLGNLFSRVIAMAHKYFKGVIPGIDPEIEKEMTTHFTFGNLEADALKAITEFEKAMEGFAFHKGLIAIWEFISQMNKYIDVIAPWELAKKETSRKQLEVVIYYLLEGLRIISGLIYPIMPNTAETMQKHLGADPDWISTGKFYRLDYLRQWKVIKPGTKLPKSVSLFPRIDTKKVKSDSVAPGLSVEPTNSLDVSGSRPLDGSSLRLEPSIPEIKQEITFEDFGQVDLRVATVVHAEAIPRAKKLLKLEVDIGVEKRTIVAGIAASYTPEEMVGKQVIIVANLKPAKLMGILSQGMLLAATQDSKCSVLALDKSVKPGTPAK